MKKGIRTPPKLIKIVDRLDLKGIGPEGISRLLSKYISRRTVYRLLPIIRAERERGELDLRRRIVERIKLTLPPQRPVGGVLFRSELDLLTRAVDPRSGMPIQIRRWHP